MAPIPPHLKVRFQSVANPKAVIVFGHTRFTVLSDRLFRMEFNPKGHFEDRPTQAFWYRKQPVPRFSAKRTGRAIEIKTKYLRLTCKKGKGGFSAKTLSVDLLDRGTQWHYGSKDRDNLLGTTRTLDNRDGPARLEHGLMSRNGWSVVEDSGKLVFNDEGWIQPRFQDPESREARESQDLYFFGYGNDYSGCLRDFCKVSGNVPLLPRWSLGNWWSRYWEYTQDELTELMREFKKQRVPLSVCIVDMDWHTTKNSYHSGWTGYTWNRELFPNPGQFMRWLHRQGIKTGLNLHPAQGIHPHEKAYPKMAERMGIDPKTKLPVKFDIADPEFTKAYFEVLHHPLEKEGVDFWWMDWQQGKDSLMPGLDPLWWLNHLHFYDLARNNRKRPFVFSRWGKLGNHRYQIGFSGDTIVTWASLAYQPYFTQTATNVGYTWWSHDIGGHMGGTEDPELYLRWVQYGVFSPILRLHSSSNPYLDRRPWGHGDDVLRAAREALQLRHALIPYIYAMSYLDSTQSVPLIRPMYYTHPDHEQAYASPNQYWFGTELIAAPFVQPRDPDTLLSRQSVWLPKGEWWGFFSGRHYPGNRSHVVYGKQEDIPVLAKAGAIVPMAGSSNANSVANPTQLLFHVFPGADGHFGLYEDDGESLAYRKGASCITPVEHKWEKRQWQFTVKPARGDRRVLPGKRMVRVLFHGIHEPKSTVIRVGGSRTKAATQYNPDTGTVSVGPLPLQPERQIVIRLTAAGKDLARRDQKPVQRCRELLKEFRMPSQTKWRVLKSLDGAEGAPEKLGALVNGIRPSQYQALMDVLNGTGG